MQKYALVTTISRFTLYFLAFIATILNCRFFAKANEFILKSFIYANFIIVLSSIADYYIYDFNRLLVDNFGHMETKHSAIRIGQITYLRPSGFVTDTNLTAFTIAFASYLLILNRNKFNKFFTYAFYLLSGYSFGMLASRSALLLVIFFLAAALIFKQINWKPILIFTIIFSPIQLLTPQTQGRFFQVADKSKKVEEMETGRPLIWKADVFAMQVKPLLGLGTNVFFKQSDIFISKVRGQINDDIYLKELSDSSHQPEEGINPHNIFLSMIVEYGIAGILLFLILVIYNFNYILRIKKWNSLIAFTGILFVSSISNYAPYYKYYMLLCTVFYVNIKNDLRIERDAGQKK
ncbi:MAG TPA: O-antigen ligase family protein [Ignavibacteria bacterium]